MTEETKAPELSINDLIVLAQVVQVSATRGGIQADEMTAVGVVYDKLVAFLEASGAVTRKPAEQTTEE